MRVHKVTFAALAVAASLSLTACNNGDDAAQNDPSSSSSTAASSGGGSGSGSSDQDGGKGSGGKDSGGQGSAAGTGSGEGSKLGKCRTDDLDITAQDSTIDGDTAGTVAVTMKNGGGRDCAMSGYPGVDLKTSAGSLSATRTGEKAPSITLKDGESTSFGISYPMNDSGGSGVSITGLVVTPPNETKSFALEWPGAPRCPSRRTAPAPR